MGFSCDPDIETARIKSSDRINTRSAGNQIMPGSAEIEPDRGNDAYSGNDDAKILFQLDSSSGTGEMRGSILSRTLLRGVWYKR